MPRGTVVEFDWNESKVYPGTSRRVWVHVPDGYDPSEPAALMVFQVVSFLGSFAQMPGGNPYPAAIRDEPAKPLRIFMQAGTRDLNWNKPQRNWFSNNLKVAAALAEAGYDHRLVLGDGGHSPNHGGVLLPDALRWLWR